VDNLLKEAQGHEKIYESLALFEKSLNTFPGNFENFNDFINTYIVEHFKFETKNLFPIVLTSGTQEEKDLVRELQEEHRKILILCRQFHSLIDQHGLQPTGTHYNEVKDNQKNIIESILVHAQKEDDNFFPILKKYGKNI
jgi:hemerythrin-like domain-containing protein